MRLEWRIKGRAIPRLGRLGRKNVTDVGKPLKIMQILDLI